MLQWIWLPEHRTCFHKEPLFNSEPTKYSEYGREWIAYRSLALKQWRKEASVRLWSKEGVHKPRPDGLIMSDTWLIALAKNAEHLLDEQALIQFLELWYGVDKYRLEILDCLKTVPSEKPPANTGSASSLVLVPRSDRKEALKDARASTKAKYMDDPVVARHCVKGPMACAASQAKRCNRGSNEESRRNREEREREIS